jgi:V/A-type H+-transporting ATPase subunit B
MSRSYVIVKTLFRYTNILEIVGDIVKIKVPLSGNGQGSAVKFGDLAILENSLGKPSTAQVISINRGNVVATSITLILRR